MRQITHRSGDCDWHVSILDERVLSCRPKMAIPSCFQPRPSEMLHSKLLQAIIPSQAGSSRRPSGIQRRRHIPLTDYVRPSTLLCCNSRGHVEESLRPLLAPGRHSVHTHGIAQLVTHAPHCLRPVLRVVACPSDNASHHSPLQGIQLL